MVYQTNTGREPNGIICASEEYSAAVPLMRAVRSVWCRNTGNLKVEMHLFLEVNVGGRISADRNGLSLIRSFSMVWHCKKVVWHGNKRQSRCRNWIYPEKRNCSRRIVNTCSIGRSQKKSWIGAVPSVSENGLWFASENCQLQAWQ